MGGTIRPEPLLPKPRLLAGAHSRNLYKGLRRVYTPVYAVGILMRESRGGFCACHDSSDYRIRSWPARQRCAGNLAPISWEDVGRTYGRDFLRSLFPGRGHVCHRGPRRYSPVVGHGHTRECGNTGCRQHNWSPRVCGIFSRRVHAGCRLRLAKQLVDLGRRSGLTSYGVGQIRKADLAGFFPRQHIAGRRISRWEHTTLESGYGFA